MPDILIRDLDAKALQRLKAQAKRHGRSLQAEAKLALERAAGLGRDEVAAMLERWKGRFAGRRFTASADLIHEDRER